MTLTARERQVIVLAAEGLTSASIGTRLGCAEGTVRKHLEHVYAKLCVQDRVSAVVAAQRAGLL